MVLEKNFTQSRNSSELACTSYLEMFKLITRSLMHSDSSAIQKCCLDVVVLFHRDDDFPSGVFFFKMPNSFSRLT